MRRAMILSLLLLGAVSCHNSMNMEYEGIPFLGSIEERNVRFFADTLAVDASATSTDGEWFLHNGRLFFLDHNMVGIKEYDLEGNYLTHHIRRGRGPGENPAPFFCGVMETQGFTGFDQGWFIKQYDTEFELINSFRYEEDLKVKASTINRLLLRPDPENPLMYEMNLMSKKMVKRGARIILPIVTEHVRYNGYNKRSRAKRFWNESYIFMEIDSELKKTGHLFGHYPPVYHNSNIPAFSDYYFDLKNDSLYVAFAADPNIYVFGRNNKLLFAFGYDALEQQAAYPETVSFEEYETRFRADRSEYGYYTGLLISGEYVFRTYKKQNNMGYGIQIYEGTKYIGEMHFKEEVRLIDYSGGILYLALPPDIDKDEMIIVKTKICI